MLKKLDKKIERIILSGGVGVLRTDTLYGLIGSALSKKSVEKIYKLKKRKPDKPFIILISSIKDLAIFKIKIDSKTKKFLHKTWPGKVSVILPCRNRRFHYLHRGADSLAFRLPANKKLKDFLKRTGPLVVPSANPEGLKPARTVKQARKYFGDRVDFYIDSGRFSGLPSTIIAIKDEKVIIVRFGIIKKIKSWR